jgi:hypothetical protein
MTELEPQTARTVLTLLQSEYTGAAQTKLEVLGLGAADDADDVAQSVVRCRTHVDRPSPRSPFTTENDLNAKHPKERLRTTQPAGKRAGISWPVCAPLRDVTHRQDRRRRAEGLRQFPSTWST